MSFLLENWRSLYTNMTIAELALEPAIAAIGRPYRCQHPFWGLSCFADFLLVEDRTVIEVDGSSHLGLTQKIKDLSRTIALLKRGYRTVRIWNEDAISDPSGSLSKALRGTCDTLPDLEERLRVLQLSAPAPTLAPRSRSNRRKAKATQAP